MGDGFWWAEHEDIPDDHFPWVPTIQVAGLCLSLPIRFATEDECREWIADNVIGAELESKV